MWRLEDGYGWVEVSDGWRGVVERLLDCWGNGCEKVVVEWRLVASVSGLGNCCMVFELALRLPRGGCSSSLCASRDSRTIQRDGRDAGNEVAQTERGGFRSSSLGDKLPRSVFRLGRASRHLRARHICRALRFCG